jgi:hypothetical protein
VSHEKSLRLSTFVTLVKIFYTVPAMHLFAILSLTPSRHQLSQLLRSHELVAPYLQRIQ